MLALLDDYAPAGLEETADVWTVFFQSVDTRQAALSAIVLALGGDGVTAEARDIPDEAWAERSQADLRAIRVGRLTIAPPWDLPARPTDDTIVITPSFGFGTGHHASTRLALEAIQQVPFRGRSVLDLGSGSGVVAIAARRLGAASVVAVEVDPAGSHKTSRSAERSVAIRVAASMASRTSGTTARRLCLAAETASRRQRDAAPGRRGADPWGSWCAARSGCTATTPSMAASRTTASKARPFSTTGATVTETDGSGAGTTASSGWTVTARRLMRSIVPANSRPRPSNTETASPARSRNT